MANSQINIISLHRYLTRDLTVVPELLGLSHEFTFSNGQVKIELPSSDNLPKEIRDAHIMESDDSLLAIKSYREEDGSKLPLEVSVKSVDVQVDLGEVIALPDEVFTRQANPVDLISKSQRTHLDRIMNSYARFADDTLDRWIRILRWKSGNGSIARPEIHGLDSGWGTHLLDRATKHRFWRSGITLNIYLGIPVTVEIWQDVEATIKQGQESSVYVDLMFDGIEQLRVGNLQQSVVQLAVACEVFMRTRVMHNLPKGLPATIVKYIDEASISKVQDHFFKDTLDNGQKKVL